MKYSDAMIDWLVDEGYTHCFYVAGGNIMHLLNSVRTRMVCIPVVHEVAAGIAVEYFNEVAPSGRAFALVTAGPGLTNIVTAMAGAYLESRELLVVGGQVKSSDLSDGTIRQRGIQEVDGIALARPVSVQALQVRTPIRREELVAALSAGSHGRKGPVFIEVCLDAQAGELPEGYDHRAGVSLDLDNIASAMDGAARVVAEMLEASSRPLVLLGGGLSRSAAARLLPEMQKVGIPIATTWNAADRIGTSDPLYFGRPNTWGMRWANVLLQQADLVIAVGTRLGMQQTGFNWQEFVPGGRVVQVDIDANELAKGHPHVDLAIHGDAGEFLGELVEAAQQSPPTSQVKGRWEEWRAFGHGVRHLLPLNDPSNTHGEGFCDPYEFVMGLGDLCRASDVIVPCSSGGAFTVVMQAFGQKSGQVIVTDKGLASMGYGLSGAFGASVARAGSRTVLIEGDGGFAQNLQELGTVMAARPNLKIFIFANSGYASIRMTQRNYFDGAYMGCDNNTGLGLPDWRRLFEAYDLPVMAMDPVEPFSQGFMDMFEAEGPAGFIVPIDPEQTYYPKINSRVTESGSMESAPLHVMFPELGPDVACEVFKYLTGSSSE